MTLTALTRYISESNKADIFLVERDGQGGANIYFTCKNPKTGKVEHFTIGCGKAEKIRVHPEKFSKLELQSEPGEGVVKGKQRKTLYFDDMYVVGYGFESIQDVPMG